MGKPTLTKRRSVIEISALSDNYVSFMYEQPDMSDLIDISISKELWAELGKPGEVTITIEPGDNLND